MFLLPMTPSRALEETPFEDLFARLHASSPDPWSTYTHTSPHGTREDRAAAIAAQWRHECFR
jgi:hypothetical protein